MRKSIVIAVLAATCIAPTHAQTLSAPPPISSGTLEIGGFVGARVRISLGRNGNKEKNLRVGLAFAPMQYRSGGEFFGLRSHIGEGLEFGFNGKNREPQLSMAGLAFTSARDASRDRPADGNRNNLSNGTIAVAGVVGLLVVVGGALALSASGNPDPCNPGECDNN